jgi:hypothetical protein
MEVGRDHGVSFDPFRNYLLRYPLKGIVKLVFLYTRKIFYDVFPALFSRWQKLIWKRTLSYARKISTRNASRYLFPGDYYELQFQQETVPALVLAEGETVSQTIVPEKESALLMGICPIVHELNPGGINAFHVKVELKSAEGTRTFNPKFPYNRTDLWMHYGPGQKTIPLTLGLGEYAGKTVEIKVSPGFSRAKGSKADEKMAVCYPKLVSRETAPRNIIILSLESMTDLAYLRHHYAFVPPMPNLDAFVRDAVAYPYSYTTADITLSFSSSVTSGLLSSQHAIGDYRIPGGSFYQNTVNPAITTLAEVAHSAGHLTSGLTLFPRYSPKIGLARGYDIYRHWMAKSDSTTPSVEHVVQKLRTFAGISQFIYAHLDYIHEPYFLFRDHLSPNIVDIACYANQDRQKVFREQLQYLDDQIGQLIESLKEQQMYESTCIVITGDHGCDLNWKKHSQNALYEERVRVPLYIKYPSWSKFRLDPNRRVNTAPEIHRLVHGITGVAQPEYFDELPQYDAAFSGFAFSETIMNPEKVWERHMLAISDGDYKYVCRNRIDWNRAKILEKQDEFLYRYSSAYDINETENLADIEPEKRRYYSDRAYEVLDRNLAFLAKYPATKY